jgi:hypothetical protein
MRKAILFAAASFALVPAGASVRASGNGDASNAGVALHLVPMDEIRVPIIDGDRADGTLLFKLVLVAKDEAAAAHATATLPALRSASLGAAVEFARLYASPLTPVDAMRLATDVTAALRGDSGITRVLVVEVSARQA